MIEHYIEGGRKREKRDKNKGRETEKNTTVERQRARQKKANQRKKCGMWSMRGLNPWEFER